MQGFHGGGAELAPPRVGGVGGSLLCGPGARPAAFGQSEYPGPGIAGIGFAGNVPALNELLDELTGSLLRHAQMLGDVHHGGVARADPRERESVGWPDISEAALGQPVLNPVSNLRGSAKDEHRNGRASLLSHDHSLTDRSI
jgi:hypothetical protein